MCIIHVLYIIVLSFSAQCAELGTPHSGNMSLSSDGQQTTASYQCAVGYHLDGVSERVCADSGNWDSIAPICSKCIFLSFSFISVV